MIPILPGCCADAPASALARFTLGSVTSGTGSVSFLAACLRALYAAEYPALASASSASASMSSSPLCSAGRSIMVTTALSSLAHAASCAITAGHSVRNLAPATATTFSSTEPEMLAMASATTPVSTISKIPGCTLDMDSVTDGTPCLAARSERKTTKHLENLVVLLDCSRWNRMPQTAGSLSAHAASGSASTNALRMKNPWWSCALLETSFWNTPRMPWMWPAP
mmetsp:Transcript_13646/g.57767  ORF Transcript_13646/g.57767 Transcript_13646/m.57767 type:complete len:224 (+) Transcript_13646:209-880(+)